MNEPVVADLPTAPARPVRLTVDFREEPDALVIHKRIGGPWVFLLLWLIGWTVGCVFVLANVINDPSLLGCAFALPFCASWLFVACLVIRMLFGKETLSLGRDDAQFRRSALIPLTSRVVPRSEIQGFRECRSTYTENDQHLLGIEMHTLGNPVQFDFRLPERERAWLIYQLNQFLEKSRPAPKRHLFPPALTTACNASAADSARSDPAPVAVQVLTLERTLPAPPTDCSWQFTEELDTFGFRQKGRLSIGPLAGLLFVSAFWNGIVSIFLMSLFGPMPNGNPLQGADWWLLFFFLIPFEAIGLFLLAALLMTVLEPFRRTTWRFEQDGIVSQTNWLVYRRAQAWDAIALDRLELRRQSDDKTRTRKISEMQSILTGDSRFDLAFVSDTNVDVCQVLDLTEGEARWFGRAILERRRNWFRR